MPLLRVWWQAHVYKDTGVLVWHAFLVRSHLTFCVAQGSRQVSIWDGCVLSCVVDEGDCCVAV